MQEKPLPISGRMASLHGKVLRSIHGGHCVAPFERNFKGRFSFFKRDLLLEEFNIVVGKTALMFLVAGAFRAGLAVDRRRVPPFDVRRCHQTATAEKRMFTLLRYKISFDQKVKKGLYR